ncbi:MAG: ECF transporter S component [Firmicutes bacterium]|nr:ECF transporter S component [Bacillota bacterium]
MQTNVRKVAILAMMVALSLLLIMFVKVPLFANFLIYEPGDVPILIVGFMFGPAMGIVASLIVAVAMALFTGLGGPFGAFMHFLATGTMVGLAGSVYRLRRTKGGAMLGMLAGGLTMAAIMVVANLLLDPIFYGMPREAVLPLLAPAIIPFNLAKAGINSVVTFVLYKRTATFLRRYSQEAYARGNGSR